MAQRAGNDPDKSADKPPKIEIIQVQPKKVIKESGSKPPKPPKKDKQS
jgi:hypothetical protein